MYVFKIVLSKFYLAGIFLLIMQTTLSITFTIMNIVYVNILQFINIKYSCDRLYKFQLSTFRKSLHMKFSVTFIIISQHHSNIERG